FASGNVVAVSAAGDTRTLARGANIFAADTVITGADSTAQIRLIDDGLISFQPGTEFHFAEFTYDGPGAAPDSSIMTMVRGRFRTITGQIGEDDDDDYRHDTPYASIGIRGTTHGPVIDPLSNSLITGVWDGGTTVFNNVGSLNLGLGADFDFSQTFIGQAPIGLLDEPAQLVSFSNLLPPDPGADGGEGDGGGGNDGNDNAGGGGNAGGGDNAAAAAGGGGGGGAAGNQAQALAAAPAAQQLPDIEDLPAPPPTPAGNNANELLGQRANASPTSILARTTGDDTEAVINPAQNARNVAQLAAEQGQADGGANNGNNPGNGNNGNGNSGNNPGN